jgi:DNA-binding MarR family transcriptional regulator
MTEESGPMLSPGFWLHHAALVWRAELDTRLRPLGLTPTQFMLLASAGWLEHTSGPPTQQAVAEQAGADRMMTSKIVRTLEERGLLERRQDAADGRAVRLTLTADGRTLVRKATAIARDLDTEFFGTDAAKMRAKLRAIARPSG